MMTDYQVVVAQLLDSINSSRILFGRLPTDWVGQAVTKVAHALHVIRIVEPGSVQSSLIEQVALPHAHVYEYRDCWSE